MKTQNQASLLKKTGIIEVEMVKFVRGDITKSDVEAMVNTVNCVGYMGRGIALQFKKMFPLNFKEYEIACKQKIVVPGKMLVHSTSVLTNPKYIINFPTKRHWKSKSSIIDIEMGLVDLVKVIQEFDIKSIAVPPLGCGLGGLNWNEVRPLIQSTLENIQGLDVMIFEPSDNQEIVNFKNETSLTNSRAAFIGLIHNYLNACMDVSITLLEIHKLLYFLQESGENLRLRFQKAEYGPYADNLRHVLLAMNGYYISGFSSGIDNPKTEIALLSGAHQKAMQLIDKYESLKSNFQRVVNLVDGFETSFGLELLSSVHWVCSKENAKELSQVVEKVHTWNEKKAMFAEAQIEIAWKTLKSQNWI